MFRRIPPIHPFKTNGRRSIRRTQPSRIRNRTSSAQGMKAVTFCFDIKIIFDLQYLFIYFFQGCGGATTAAP